MHSQRAGTLIQLLLFPPEFYENTSVTQLGSESNNHPPADRKFKRHFCAGLSGAPLPRPPAPPAGSHAACSCGRWRATPRARHLLAALRARRKEEFTWDEQRKLVEALVFGIRVDSPLQITVTYAFDGSVATRTLCSAATAHPA